MLRRDVCCVNLVCLGAANFKARQKLNILASDSSQILLHSLVCTHMANFVRASADSNRLGYDRIATASVGQCKAYSL